MATYILTEECYGSGTYEPSNVIMKTHNVKKIFKYEKNLLRDRQSAERLESSPHFLYVINGSKIAIICFFDLKTEFNHMLENYLAGGELAKVRNCLILYLFELDRIMHLWDVTDSIDEITID